MSAPRFAVGESVTAVFKNYPQHNGEYTVLEVLGPAEAIERFPGFQYSMQWYYVLEGLDVVGSASLTHRSSAAGESSLRKRHQPGEYTWEGLKAILSLPVTREEMQRVARISHG